MIEKSTLPEADLIIGGNWTDLNEDKYAEISTEQHANAGKAAESGMAVDTMANAVGESMKGESAEASAAVSQKRSSNMSTQQVTHSNRALGTGLISQAIANFKTSVNATVGKYNTAWEATKAQAVANEWPQQKITEEKDKLVTEHQNEVSVLKNNFDATNSALEKSVASGEEPTVPKTMPTVPSGESTPQTGVPPEIGQQMSQMLGGLGQMAQHTPGSDVINPAVQSLTQALGGMGSGSGDVPLTADALDTLLAGQSDGGDTDSGTLMSDTSPADSSDSAEDKADASPTVTASHHDFAEDGRPSPAAVPVSASTPSNADVPTTHLSGDTSVPVTDAAGAPAPVSGGSGGSVGQMPSNSSGGGGEAVYQQASGHTAPEHSVPTQPTVADTSAGTQLSASSGTAMAGSSSALGGPSLGGVGAPPPSMGGGLGGGGMVGGMGGGMPVGGLGPMAGSGVAMGAPSAPPSFPATMAPPPAAAGTMAAAVTPTAPPPMSTPMAAPSHTPAPAAGVPNAPSAVSAPRPDGVAPSSTDGQRSGGGTGAPMTAMPFPSTPKAPAAGTVYHPDSPFSVEDRQAATVANALIEGFARGGISAPVAVALLDTGTAVFCTSDGLGFIPSGTRIPENVVPLSEYTNINTNFRTDMTGNLRPGDVLKLAASIEILKKPLAIISTGSDVESGVTRISLEMLSGAPRLETPITRDMFGKISVEDVPLALETLKQEWGVGDIGEDDLDEAVIALSDSRWEKVDNPAAVTALARYMVADAQQCVQEDRVSEAAYVLNQFLKLGDAPRG